MNQTGGDVASINARGRISQAALTPSSSPPHIPSNLAKLDRLDLFKLGEVKQTARRASTIDDARHSGRV